MLELSDARIHNKQSVYKVPNGMPLSVFRDRYARMIDGVFQDYSDRAKEMALGNMSLDGDIDDEERNDFISYAMSGLLPMSGRHLQHGDDTQINRSIEVFTNCSTAAFSFLSFYLLLNGSGVGRDYSTESCRVDWDYMPNVRLVLDGGSDDSGSIAKGAHPDFAVAINEFSGFFDTLLEATHKYDSESENVRWFNVRDSREGWAEAIAALETAAFHKNHKDSLFIFNFSGVRGRGSPIKGMQNRPAQGPIPLMRAIAKICTIKGTRMKPWKQALFIDHYLAACVVMGLVRRSARMSTKWWKDRDTIEFIDIKRGGFLWSANNSVLVDEEFWEQASDPSPSHGRRVFEAIAGAAYYDKTGEPGIINIHLMNQNKEGFDKITAGTYLNKRFDLRLHPKTYLMIDNILNILKSSGYPFICNPCQSGFATVLTQDGVKTFDDIDVGSTIWSGKQWTKVIRKICTGVKPVNAYKTGMGVFVGTADHYVIAEGWKTKISEAKVIDVCPTPSDFVNPFVSVGDVYDEIESITYLGEHRVYDITVDAEEHTYWTGGCLVSNCGEIVLAKFGGYCVIADIALNHARSKEDVKRVAVIAARALIRTNLMPALYQSEVDRTNRIGVGLTGIFEYAWQHYNLNFYDLISAYDYIFNKESVNGHIPVSLQFWNDIAEIRGLVEEAATKYAKSKGMVVPHTFTTIKPSGTISKVMACTEAAHLPPYLFYIRWVIVEKNSKRHQEYIDRGYPIKDVSHQYTNCVVVGFPTKHPILDVMPADKAITADMVSPEEQYKWIRLLDYFWLGPNNNQISYTLKYDNTKVTHHEYMNILLEWQSKVKCCAIMPFTDESAYAYVPEEKIDQITYERLIANIIDNDSETVDYDENSLVCTNGACPIEPVIN